MEAQQEAITPVTTRASGIRYGIIGAIFSIVYFLVLRMTGIDMQGPASWVTYPVVILLIFLAQKYYKDNGDGYMDYSQGIGIAFWYGLVGAGISSVFTYLYIKLMDPAFIDMIRDKQIEEMQSQGMSDQQIDQAMKFVGMFTSAEMIFVFGLIIGIITAVLIGLVLTIFTQNKRPDSGILDA